MRTSTEVGQMYLKPFIKSVYKRETIGMRGTWPENKIKRVMTEDDRPETEADRHGYNRPRKIWTRIKTRVVGGIERNGAAMAPNEL